MLNLLEQELILENGNCFYFQYSSESGIKVYSDDELCLHLYMQCSSYIIYSPNFPNPGFSPFRILLHCQYFPSVTSMLVPVVMAYPPYPFKKWDTYTLCFHCIHKRRLLFKGEDSLQYLAVLKDAVCLSSQFACYHSLHLHVI